MSPRLFLTGALFTAVFAPGCLLAEVELPPIIGSNMVVQAGEPLNFWGWAEVGEQVTISQNGSVLASAEGQGKATPWRVQLPAQKAGAVADITVAGKNTIALTNLLAGENWLCSGQSNMVMTLKKGPWCGWGGVVDADKEIAAAKDAQIRFFVVSGSKQGRTEGSWRVLSPETALEISGVAYFFARRIRAELNAPVGLIISAVGGTAIEPWTPARGLKGDPEIEALQTRLAASQKEYGAKIAADEKLNAEWKKKAAEARAKGEPQPALPEFQTPSKVRAAINNLNGINSIGGLYESKIRPLAPFNLRGAIWYQGESNARRGEIYAGTLQRMIQSWREDWGKPFPFITVALAGAGKAEAWDDGLGSFAMIREGQVKAADLVAGVGVISAADLGQVIHPPNKQDVGLRAALWALRNVYGRSLVCEGPRLSAVHFEAGKAVVTVTGEKDGLMLKSPAGFELAGEDRKFVAATAELKDGCIVVTAPGVSTSVALRYAFLNFPTCTVYNGAGLPALPFRSDSWPITPATSDGQPPASAPDTVANAATPSGAVPTATLLKWDNDKIDLWNGFVRHNLIIDGRKAWVVEPKKALPGNPWTWCMKFPDKYTAQTGVLALLDKGFFHLYIDIGNEYGSPNSLKHFDSFYAAFSQKGLAKKGTLVALSRGGLDAYGWTRDNTDKVLCIYADAPVCDFKSWPAGKGKSLGSSPKDWAKLPAAYGFKDEAEALAWTKNPIDTLEPIAKAQIPLIHVVGDLDTGVPVAENTAILEQRYQTLGGKITVIHKPTVGHNPHGLEDPTPVVDLILNYTQSALK